MDLQVVCVLVTLFTLAAGSCDVYNISQSSIIERCAQVQDCFNKALLNDRNNLYILDRVFRSTKSRPPIALIVNYHVTVITNDGKITSDYDGGSNGSGITVDSIDSRGEVTYREQLGWSSTGIYSAIRPEILISLQPRWYWFTLSFAIDNYGLPKSVHLKLNIANTIECDLLEKINRFEMKEALAHLTEKLNQETPGKVWNTASDLSSLQFYEIFLLGIMALLGITTMILILLILSILNWQSLGIFTYHSGVQCLLFVILGEIYYQKFNLNTPFYNQIVFYSKILSRLEFMLLASYIPGFIYGAILYPRSCQTILLRATIFGITSWVATSLAVFLIPVLIEAFIYPTEVITSIGFFVIAIAGSSAAYTFIGWYTRNGTKSAHKEKKKKQKVSKIKYLLLILVTMIIYNCIFIFLLFYLSLLKHRLESPTNQLTQTLLAFIPPIFAVLGSFYLEKKLGSTEATKENSNENESDENANVSNDQTPLIHSDSANEDQQPDEEQPQQTESPDIEPHETPQESEPQEIQVNIEVHPTNTSDGEDESTV